MCRARYDDVLVSVIRLYFLILFTTTTLMSFLIPGTSKQLKLDLSVMRAGIGVAVFVVMLAVVGDSIFRDPLKYESFWWIRVIETLFGIFFVMALLILYQV